MHNPIWLKKLVKKLVVFLLIFTISFPIFSQQILAAPTGESLPTFVDNTVNIITVISISASALFLIKGGFVYITSTGKPQALEEAKKTIRNVLIGLAMVLGSQILISIFRYSLNNAPENPPTGIIKIPPIESHTTSNGLIEVLINAVIGFIRHIIESGTKPIVTGVLSYLSHTPSLLGNAVIMKFWLISLGIVDSLFVVVIALLGLQVMSATTFGFEETDLRKLLPRLALAFLGANTSLFLANYAVMTCNALVKAVIDSTGGINRLWIFDTINFSVDRNIATPLIVLIFFLLFLIIAIVLLLLYISRLIAISLGAVLSPFIFLLWPLPKLKHITEVATKLYMTNVFTVFIHVIIIQLASSFIILPEHSENSLIAIAIAVGLFLTLLKTQTMLMHMVLFTAGGGIVKGIGNQLSNVLTGKENKALNTGTYNKQKTKSQRKIVKA